MFRFVAMTSRENGTYFFFQRAITMSLRTGEIQQVTNTLTILA